MGQQSNIEWTDSTWNPIRGCSPVSPGCKNCYAAKIAKRFSGPKKPFEGLVRINAAGERTDDWNGQILFVEGHLLDPLKWLLVDEKDQVTGGHGRPRRIFVNSVSDLFHENVTDEMRDKIFGVMALCPQHRFQILTKRPEAMLRYLVTGPHAGARVRETFVGRQAGLFHLNRTGDPTLEWSAFPMPNVILGTSVENQEWADKRWEPMFKLQLAGWKTFVSYEPALGPVDWVNWDFLGWLISGGETQAGSRPSHPDWHRKTRDYAAKHEIPYFFKQWGDWLPDNQNPAMRQVPEPPASGAIRLGRNQAGALLDGKLHKAFPEGF